MLVRYPKRSNNPSTRAAAYPVALAVVLALSACSSGDSDNGRASGSSDGADSNAAGDNTDPDGTVTDGTDTSGTEAGTEADTTPTGTFQRGRFLDSAVAGLAWTSESISGMTDVDGMFSYQEGESITFSIGDIVLPAVQGAAVVTALDVFETLDTNTRRVVNLNRLLQSLDKDARPENGIVIDPAAAQAATGLDVDFASTTFDESVINLVANSGSSSTELVTAQSATTHFLATLDANGIATSDCGDSHPAVGRSVALVGSSHDVGGSLTVLDDCTLEVRDFTYDGGGPDVAFYAGRAGNYGPDAVRLSPALDGRVYDGDTVRLTLPEGTTLDDVDNLSVWCFDFSVTFGDAFFGEI